jgi:ligand-binding sensor domain-containing protein
LFIRDIHEDKFGQIWVATAGGGVFCTDGKSNYTFTKADGISDNFIQSIQEDKDGNIWLGTGIGITRFSGNKPLQKKNLKSGKIKDEHKTQMFTFENPIDGC